MARATVAAFSAVLALASCSKPVEAPKVTGKGPLTVARALRAGAALDAFDATGETALTRAAMEGRADLLPLLLSRGASVLQRNALGFDPLQRACMAGHAQVAAILLAAGADPNSPTELERDTALHLAARSVCTECLQDLVSAGADVARRNRYGQQPIHFAAQQLPMALGDAVRWLIEHGATADARDDRGFTPAHFAALANNVPVLALLAERGASLDARTLSGVTPADSAAWTRADAAYRWLHVHGHVPARYDAPDPLEDAARRDDVEALLALVRFEDQASWPRAERVRLLDEARASGATNVLPLLQLLTYGAAR